MDNITGGLLINEGREVRDQLIALGGHDRLVAKIEALLSRPFLHGGEQLTLTGHIATAREILK